MNAVEALEQERQVAEHEAQRELEAAQARYAGLIHRIATNAEEPDDGELLCELSRVLPLTESIVREDAELVKSWYDAVPLSQQVDELKKLNESAATEVIEFRKNARPMLEQLEAKYAQTQFELGKAVEAARLLERLRARRSDLFAHEHYVEPQTTKKKSRK